MIGDTHSFARPLIVHEGTKYGIERPLSNVTQGRQSKGKNGAKLPTATGRGGVPDEVETHREERNASEETRREQCPSRSSKSLASTFNILQNPAGTKRGERGGKDREKPNNTSTEGAAPESKERAEQEEARTNQTTSAERRRPTTKMLPG